MFEFSISEIESFLSIILNSILIISAVFGGFWAYHTFYRNENKASLSIKINDISHSKRKDGSYF